MGPQERDVGREERGDHGSGYRQMPCRWVGLTVHQPLGSSFGLGPLGAVPTFLTTAVKASSFSSPSSSRATSANFSDRGRGSDSSMTAQGDGYDRKRQGAET